jgi:hypothetical protein
MCEPEAAAGLEKSGPVDPPREGVAMSNIGRELPPLEVVPEPEPEPVPESVPEPAAEPV